MGSTAGKVVFGPTRGIPAHFSRTTGLIQSTLWLCGNDRRLHSLWITRRGTSRLTVAGWRGAVVLWAIMAGPVVC